ncbi:RNA methyltransferase [Malonomonas rubra]|uniref:RNA methyltransferase n=1 Tax=Malonomonas rubra TaxID=57040 RepID=UPI0026F2C67A|nr:RNA methyltransferase [Malonomonas rubra]
MNTENISVVLVEPQGPRNIGSVCRAMLNFGLVDLRLVNPQTDHLLHEARQMAVKATTVLEAAKIFTSLEEAIADCALSIGTTRRFGRYREDMLHPDEAASLLLPLTDEAKVAVVFGREDKGLHTAELDLCQRFVTIPTSDKLPSMNLAQAVALCLYEISKVRGEMAGAAHGRKQLAANDNLERMYQHMRESLTKVGFLDPQNPDHILRAFRRILGRAELNEREVRIMRGLFSQIDLIDDQLCKLKKEAGIDG